MFGFGKKRDDDISRQTLSDVARGMQHAVNSVQEILERHYIKMLSRYFDEKGNPVMAHFNITPADAIEVPLITLVSPKGLFLEEVTVDMSVRIDETQVKSEKDREDKPPTVRTSFMVSFAQDRGKESPRRGNVIDITMKFKAGDPPEGVSRIIDGFINRIVQKKIEATDSGS
jgi:hypothetical protein